MKTKSVFKDYRLDKTFNRIISLMSVSGCGVINRVCRNASDKKAAYRFINDDKVTVDRISQELVGQMVKNVKAMNIKEVLVAQDTMEVVRENVLNRLKKKGKTVLECARRNKGERSHTALVMDAASGEPAGFGSIEIWGREPQSDSEEDEEANSGDRRRRSSCYITDPDTGKKRYKYNIPITERDSESARWINSAKKVRNELSTDIHIIMVQDREGDMYPLLTLPDELENLDIVVRAAKKRKCEDDHGERRDLFEYTASGEVAHRYEIKVGKTPRKKGRTASVELRFGEVTILRPHSPVYPQKSVTLHYVRVTETDETIPKDGEQVDWLLLTSLDVETVEDALKIVSYYRKRWFIEDYHRLLKKKGFGIEDIQVETPHAFEVNLAMCIKVAYEVALIKKGHDSDDDLTPASLVFTPLEIEIVSKLNEVYNRPTKKFKNPHPKGSLAWAAWVVACEGGWSAMPSQPKPGIITFKRGIDRIEDIYRFFQETNTMPTCG